MKRWTLMGLVLLVGLLVWLRSADQVEQQRVGTTQIQAVLLPDLDPSAVQRVRIEHLERGVDVRLERDGYGRWFLSDPIAYPAQGQLVDTLLDTLSQALGPPVRDADLESLALAPPRAVISVSVPGAGPDDPLSVRRVEFGALDLDGRRVHARVPGHPAADASGALVLRVVRSLDTTLDRNPDDYRDRSCTTIPMRQVTSFARRGTDPDFGLDLFADAGVWRRRDEPRVAMDPSAVGIVLRALSSLRVQRFADDAALDVSPYGLDAPRIEYELQAADGTRELLLLSTPPGAGTQPFGTVRWYAMRDGFPHVWEVRPNDLPLLRTAAEDLYDYAVLRSSEEGVERVEIWRGETGLQLEREDGRWVVGSLGPGPAVRRPADEDRVGSLLARLVQAQLIEYAAPGAFVQAERPLRLVVRTREGLDVEAELGPAPEGEGSGDAGGLLFRRAGEDLAALVPEEVEALFLLTLPDLEERLVHDVAEADVDRIELRRGNRLQAYTRDERHWSLEGSGRVDGARAVLLERLLRFEAERFLDARPALLDPLEVRFEGRDERVFELGPRADGRLVLVADGRVALCREDALQGDLHAALVATFP